MRWSTSSSRAVARVSAAALLVALVACGGDPPGRLIAVPTQTPAPLLDFSSGCPDALLEGVLVADDDAGFVVRHDEGFMTPVIWPHGYVARDSDPRQLLDGSGRIVAREGEHFSGGGGWLGETDAEGFTVCGDFEVTPAP